MSIEATVGDSLIIKPELSHCAPEVLVDFVEVRTGVYFTGVQHET